MAGLTMAVAVLVAQHNYTPIPKAKAEVQKVQSMCTTKCTNDGRQCTTRCF